MKKIVSAFFFISLIAFSNNTAARTGVIQKEEIVKSFSHEPWNELLKKYVSNAGNVNYKGFLQSKNQLNSYLKSLEDNTPDKSWSKNATLAYWINAYNAFTVKLILDNYPVKSIKDISNPWGKKFFVLGGKKYSLEKVEHEILRKMGEPRIHFAINCASFSCPNLLNEAYTENNLSKLLTQVSKSFINDKTKNAITASKIEISEIFNWFGDDFKTKGTLIEFLNEYSNTKIDAKAKITYREYNWNLND